MELARYMVCLQRSIRVCRSRGWEGNYEPAEFLLFFLALSLKVVRVEAFRGRDLVCVLQCSKGGIEQDET
jgi:hypothetical protein